MNSESGKKAPKLGFIVLNVTKLSKLVGFSKVPLSLALTMVKNEDVLF